MTSTNDTAFKSVLRTIIEKEDAYLMIVPEKKTEDGKTFWLSDGNTIVRAKGISDNDGMSIVELLRHIADNIEEKLNGSQEGTSEVGG